MRSRRGLPVGGYGWQVLSVTVCGWAPHPMIVRALGPRILHCVALSSRNNHARTADAVPSPASTIAVTPHSEGGWHPRCDVGVLDVPLAQVSMREAGMKDQRGFALVATMLVMFLITVVIGAAVTGAAVSLVP